MPDGLSNTCDRSYKVFVTRQLFVDHSENTAEAGDLLYRLVVHGGVMLDRTHPAIDLTSHFLDLSGITRGIKDGPLGLRWLRRHNKNPEKETEEELFNQRWFL